MNVVVVFVVLFLQAKIHIGYCVAAADVKLKLPPLLLPVCVDVYSASGCLVHSMCTAQYTAAKNEPAKKR